ncbi:uclacyanin-3-like [Rhododendron vialii]|uniref:uclacyanin-3-like n=1 Tax=Rhododendron vialii TaxID=182163 RepID=UPI00265E9BAE|nr:uclacyanin-3-like [Rhododendron vialii]
MAMAMAAVLLLFVLVAPTVHSLQYDVTWNLGINYNSWAAGKTFTVGDTLVFTYTLEHSVDVVDGSDYASCNTGNPLNSYTGGLTTITLTTPGSIYFICPTEGHCQAGMKLGITVAAAASPTTPTSPPPSSTTTPTSPPPASTTTPTSPPPASTTAPTSPPPASATTPTSTPSPSPSVSPSPAVTSPSRSPSSGPSPTTSTSPVVTTAPSSPKSSSGAGSMFGDMNHLVIIGFSVVVAGLAGFLV